MISDEFQDVTKEFSAAIKDTRNDIKGIPVNTPSIPEGIPKKTHRNRQKVYVV